MREIKFRAWEKSAHADGAGMMWRPGETFGDYVIHFTGDIYEKFVNSFGGESYDDYRDVSYNFILMQYTGLKDKNGKEIYEGDVVTWQQAAGGLLPPDVNPYTCVIEWGWDHAWRCKYPPKDTSFTFASSHIEIIGNIYENPELLKR